MKCLACQRYLFQFQFTVILHKLHYLKDNHFLLRNIWYYSTRLRSIPHLHYALEIITCSLQLMWRWVGFFNKLNRTKTIETLENSRRSSAPSASSAASPGTPGPPRQACSTSRAREFGYKLYDFIPSHIVLPDLTLQSWSRQTFHCI